MEYPPGTSQIPSEFATQAPSVALPKGGGAIRGIGEKFSANPATGTGACSVPIPLSPGRSGFAPALTLTYDSGNGNGAFGLGWTLSIPSITRRTDKGLPLYDDRSESDVFVLSGAEDLVPVLKKTAAGWERDRVVERPVNNRRYRIDRYRPRVEGLFARIERWTDVENGDTHWRSITRDNLTSLYGSTANSRVFDSVGDDPAHPSRVFSWLLCQSFDDKGNIIVYEYKSEDSTNVDTAQAHEQQRSPATRSANRYLKRIKYGFRTPFYPKYGAAEAAAAVPADACFEVVFDYGEHDAANPSSTESGQWLCRLDPFSSFRSGFEVRTYRLCQRVLMFHHFPSVADVGADCLVRSVDFSYRNDPRRGDPVTSTIVSVTQCGYKRSAGALLKKSMPPLEFTYSDVHVHDEIHELDAETLRNLPNQADTARYQWVDLDGEGAPGVLTVQADQWVYNRNLTPLARDGALAGAVRATFGPRETVATQPSARPMIGRQQFVDLAGDGQIDLVTFDPPMAGYFERGGEERWATYRPFISVPDVDWDDPNIKFVDLTGDGHADLLVLRDEAIIWFPSAGEEGFGHGRHLQVPFDETGGARLLFADGSESLLFVDMSGDGLSDLVRIRNGEVCYWPNLGYGQFGEKITMDDAPWFDAPDQFDHRRIRLADIDGSGVADIVYFGAEGARLYFNQAGNRWSAARSLPNLGPLDGMSALSAVDLLGNGTTCLVWSSALPQQGQAAVRYVDLMGGRKPHLLVRVVNNLGAETHIQYAASTRFYLEDKLAGWPWVTPLPFPVHVVERVETYDRVSRNRFVTRYSYHHGYFDPVEREFRGFGRVDQRDTEELAALTATGDFPDATNIDAASYVPPTLTRTWYHTGAWLEEARFTRQFEGEYYRDPGAPLLDDTVLPSAIRTGGTTFIQYTATADETREAGRALKGSMLRQEVYALDRSPAADRPYQVMERNYTCEIRQPQETERHAVFFRCAREAITFQYERKLYDVAGERRPDPRVSHTMTLATGEYGDVLRSVAIAYGRRYDEPSSPLTSAERAEQKQTLITCVENTYTNAVVEEDDAFRTPAVCESRTYELVNVRPNASNAGATNVFGFKEMSEKVDQAFDGSHDLEYEDIAAVGVITQQGHRRPVERVRAIYRRNDLSGPLAFQRLESRALPFEAYKLALTPNLVSSVYGTRVVDAMLQNEGGYVHVDGDANWWVPTGRVFYSPIPAHNAAQELAYAQQHFFVPCRFQDPWQETTAVTYDDFDLNAVAVVDPLGNRVSAKVDYRVLQPAVVTDANGNRSAAAFDALGLIVGTAAMGKGAPAPTEGDSLTGFNPDLDEATLLAHLQNPFANPHGILGSATTRQLYDLFAYQRTRSAPQPSPVVVYTIARETHTANLSGGAQSKVQHSFAYSDGFGRTIQKKAQAEPGVVDTTPVPQRWVATGWTIFNNKGQPVRQYEPFFTATHRFEFARAVGVSAVVLYDPLQRGVATLNPNHSWQKVVIEPWRQETWDANDTVSVTDPRDDVHVGSLFRRLPVASFFPTWYAARSGGQFGTDPLVRASQKAAADQTLLLHADTSAATYFDALGRSFLTVAQNCFTRQGATVAEQYRVRTTFDIEGNQRLIADQQERTVALYDYDVLGRRIHQASLEAGDRWSLNDVAGNTVRAWDSRGHRFRTEYDALHRPLHAYVAGTDPQNPAAEIMWSHTEYGEGRPNDVQLNLRTRLVRQCDSAGVATNDEYDFKGNLKRSSRRITAAHGAFPDWSANPQLDPRTFTSSTAYDALNRPVVLTFPEGTVVRPSYNEASLLKRLDVNIRSAAVPTRFIANIEYDPRGQRRRIEYGNGTTTEYAYDALTFRLTSLTTTRAADGAILQDLRYTYDPVGNTTEIRDAAQSTVYFSNAAVSADATYIYDAIYRLIEASGREHIGQASQPQTTYDDRFRIKQAHPADGLAMRRYTERYEYDEAGNLEHLRHFAPDGNWTRDFTYKDVSPFEGAQYSNRLTRTDVGAVIETYQYDAHGNMTTLPHLAAFAWDFKDQLRYSQQQVVAGGASGERTYNAYDAGGARIRKVTQTQSGVRRNERVYVGNVEIYREFDAAGGVTLERETLHVMADVQRIALIETRTQGSDGGAQQLVRYQLGNHLGSAVLEVDAVAQVITYEEFYPFGSTSFQAVRSQTETPKRFRYSAKERDEESGLAYHGARYYAPWLCRWTACDPVGTKDGLNLYRFVANNPIGGVDRDGRQTNVAFDPTPTKGRTTFTIQQAARSYNEAQQSGDPEATRFYYQQLRLALIRSANEEAKFGFKVWAVMGITVVAGVTGGLALEGGIAALGLGGFAEATAVEKVVLLGASGFVSGGVNVGLEQLRRLGFDEKLMSEGEVVLTVGISTGTPIVLYGAGNLLSRGVDLAKRAPELGRYLKNLSASARMQAAVDADAAAPVLSPELNNWQNREDVAKRMLDIGKSEQGMTLMPSQFKNGQGLDAPFRNAAGDAVDVHEIKGLLEYEAGDIERALSQLKNTQTMGTQMSSRYIDAQATRLMSSPSSTSAMRATGQTIQNASKVIRYLTVIDEYGSLETYDLEFWEMYRWKTNWP
jgi:RHS repeat-associated protein